MMTERQEKMCAELSHLLEDAGNLVANDGVAGVKKIFNEELDVPVYLRRLSATINRYADNWEKESSRHINQKIERMKK